MEKLTAWDVVRGTWQVQHAIFAESQAELSELGLTPKSLSVLGILEYLPRPTQIAESIGAPLPTISNLLKELESAGYVTRNHAAPDRRQVQYSRTELGDQMMWRGIGAVNRGASDRMSRLSEAEHAMLVQLLEKLNARILR
ncbi:MAG: MarR family transcriptional regulator [Fimbriimonadaceae bacterium]|nr:MarR family transcriptional regulator [Fimbriimonadaceae bacterium]